MSHAGDGGGYRTNDELLLAAPRSTPKGPGIYEGVVRWFNPTKANGIGFVAREDGEGDIFIGAFALDFNGLTKVEVGDRLFFEIEIPTTPGKDGERKPRVGRIHGIIRGPKYLEMIAASRGAAGQRSGLGQAESRSTSEDRPSVPIKKNAIIAEVKRKYPEAQPFAGRVIEYDSSRGHGTVRSTTLGTVHFKHDLLPPNRLIPPRTSEPMRGLCIPAAGGVQAAVWLEEAPTKKSASSTSSNQKTSI